MKNPASLTKIVSHIFLALVIFLLICLVFINHSEAKAIFLMFWGAYFFVDFLKLMLIGTNYSIGGAYIVFYVGCLIIVISAVWLGNLAFKTILNPIFSLLSWEFRIGNLFSGVSRYIFSLPGLIVGFAMIISAALWENNAQYQEWYQGLFPGVRKKMFRREF